MNRNHILRTKLISLSFFLLFAIFSCKQERFKGIQHYYVLCNSNKETIESLIFDCTRYSGDLNNLIFSDSTISKNRPVVVDSLINKKLLKCHLKEMIKYKNGEIHLIFKRDFEGQTFAVFVIYKSDMKNSKNIKSNAYYLEKLWGDYVLIAESDN